MTEAELAEALAQRGLMRASAVDAAARESDAARPWFIGVMLGAAGWLAGVLVLLFVDLLFEPSTANGFALAGVVMLVASLGLYFADRDGAFFAQLALALWIAGQLGVAWWAGEMHSGAQTAGILAALELVLLFVTPNGMARALASFCACIAWAVAVRLAWWDEGLFIPYEHVALGPALLAWLGIWAPIAAIVGLLIFAEPTWMVVAARRLVRPALGGLLAALAIGTWASEPFAGLPFLARGDDFASWLALWPLLGTVMALYAAGCAFRLRERPLLGLAVAGALLHATQFYYVLGTTLVVKSVIMLAAGGVCLGVARVLRGHTLARDSGDAT